MESVENKEIPLLNSYDQLRGEGLSLRRRNGFTLMELMVYIALLGGIVLIAGQAFSDSTRMRVRTQNMLQASEVAESVANLIKADIAQTGAKSSMEAGVSGVGAQYGNSFSGIYTDLYMDPDDGDSSSFSITTQDGFDSLTIRRLRYDDCGFFLAKEQIAWYVRNGKLLRKCFFIPNTMTQIDDAGNSVVVNIPLTAHDPSCKSTIPDDDPCKDSTEVEVAEGVSMFTVIPGKPGVVGDDIQLFPATGVTEFRLVGRNDGARELPLITNETGEVNKGGNTQTLTNFYQNYDPSSSERVKSDGERKINEVIAIRNETTTITSWQSLCNQEGNHFTFEPGEQYEISFEISSPATNEDKSKVFVPGVDYMSVGFRDKETGNLPKVNDVVQVSNFTFFPPMGLKGEGSGPGRSMRFSVAKKVENVCLAFTFACYSPLVSQGKVSITNLKLIKIPSANYSFENYDFNAHKHDKQNVKAFLLKLDVKRNGESGHVDVVVPAPSNGPHD